MPKAELPPTTQKREIFEFPSIVEARLVRGPTASFFDKTQNIFGVKITPMLKDTDKKENALRFEITGPAVDVELVVRMLRDVGYEAGIVARRESLTEVKHVQPSHVREIQDYVAKCFPAYAAQHGGEKRMERIADRAAAVAAGETAERLRRTMTVVASPPAAHTSPAPHTPPPDSNALKITAAQAKTLQEMREFAPRNQSQSLLYTALKHPDIALAFALGAAGGGKSYVPLTAGFEEVRAGTKKQVYIFRARTTTGRGDLGAVKGDILEKMRPYLAAQDDNILKVTGQSANSLVKKGVLHLDTGDLIRGDTIDDAFIIVDDAQNYSVPQLKAIVTRLGRNSRMVFSGDISSHQNDLGPHESGLTHIAARMISKARSMQGGYDRLAVVFYKADDSSARSDVMPFINDALETLPDGFADIPQHVSAHNREIIQSIEENRVKTVKLCRKFSSITENRFKAEANLLWATTHSPEGLIRTLNAG